jgi:organic radical activating enzyme
MLHTLGSISFYITNVCNLNCHNCSHLNNYPVKGHQRWKDNQDSCAEWGKKVDPARIFVLGGEPMLNPDFMLWINGLATLWPEAEIRINTNGTCFDRWPTLYETLKKYQGRVSISISGHNSYHKEKLISTIKKFLQGNITEKKGQKKDFHSWVWKKIYSKIKDPSWPEITTFEDYHLLPETIKQEIENIHQVKINDYMVYNDPVEDYEVYVDENNVKVSWARWDEFKTSAVKFNALSQVMTMHQSDPVKAVKSCHGGHCAYIKNGKFYKCEVMGILPDMFEQNFPFDISHQDKELILSYEPALPIWDDLKLNKFFDGLMKRDPIPQCKFCPEKKLITKIYADNKKIKVQKNQQK